jgi:hypothetical protein
MGISKEENTRKTQECDEILSRNRPWDLYHEYDDEDADLIL